MSKHEPRQAITRNLESAQCAKADIRKAKRERYAKRVAWHSYTIGYIIDQIVSGQFNDDND